MNKQNYKNHSKRAQRVMRFLEFFVVGVVFGISEDLIAIFFVTGEPITPKILLIASLVAIPFAAFSELVVDSPGFRRKVRHLVSLVVPDFVENNLPK
ncbi:MAG: hypothetical protein WAP23_03830 [Candidatus Spechtbacterales bacterium]